MEEIIKTIRELEFDGKLQCIDKLSEFYSRCSFLEKQYVQHLKDIECLTEMIKTSVTYKDEILSLSKQAKMLEEENIQLKNENQDLKKAFDIIVQSCESCDGGKIC